MKRLNEEKKYDRVTTGIKAVVFTMARKMRHNARQGLYY